MNVHQRVQCKHPKFYFTSLDLFQDPGSFVPVSRRPVASISKKGHISSQHTDRQRHTYIRTYVNTYIHPSLRPSLHAHNYTIYIYTHTIYIYIYCMCIYIYIYIQYIYIYNIYIYTDIVCIYSNLCYQDGCTLGMSFDDLPCWDDQSTCGFPMGIAFYSWMVYLMEKPSIKG